MLWELPLKQNKKYCVANHSSEASEENKLNNEDLDDKKVNSESFYDESLLGDPYGEDHYKKYSEEDTVDEDPGVKICYAGGTRFKNPDAENLYHCKEDFDEGTADRDYEAKNFSTWDVDAKEIMIKYTDDGAFDVEYFNDRDNDGHLKNRDFDDFLVFWTWDSVNIG